MFSRVVTMHLKPPYQRADLKKRVEELVIPLLRKQEGFKDEMLFASADGKEAISVSLWDRKEHADTYSQKAYPQVLQGLTNLFEGSPEVKTYEVLTSTHKIAALA